MSINAASIRPASSSDSTPARASARAQAMLPVASSSNRRRSKRKDEPNAKAAASGAVSNRPDQRLSSGHLIIWIFEHWISGQLLLSSRQSFETFRQRGGPAHVARDDQNGVVAANGPDSFRQLRPIDRDGQGLGLPDAGADDDQMLDVVDPLEELAGGPLEAVRAAAGLLSVRPSR